jgi:Major tropism determinant N-terminal domain
MSLQIRRGTEAERLTITPLTGELIYTTDTQLVYVGDNVTPGGILVSGGGGPSNYGNANVVALLNSGLAGNIIPTVDSLYSLGNSTNQWKDLYVSNATIYLDNVPLTANSTTVFYDGVPLLSADGTANITTTGTITGGNIVIDAVGGGITFADGTTQTTAAQPYTDSDVADFLESGTLASNVVTTANISGAFILGDGSQLINLPAGNYSNANVESYLDSGTLTSNIVTSGNIETTANVSAGFFIGDGSGLSNVSAEVQSIPAIYFPVVVDGNNQTFSNSYLASYTSNTDITLFFNGALLDSPYYTLSGDTVTINTELSTGDSIDIIRTLVSNVNVTPAITSIPAVYFDVTVDGNNQTFSNTFLSAYQSNTDITLFYNGALLDSPYYTLSGDTLTINTELSVGDSIDVIRQFASNIVVSTYSNANVQSYLASALVGNVIPAGNNLASLGNATNQFKDLWVSNATIFFDSIPLSVNSNAEITFNGAPLVSTGGNQEINTTGNVDAGNIIVTGDISSNTFLGNTADLTGNITVGGVLTDNYFYANGSPLVFSDYGNANVAAYLPTYTGELTSVGNITTVGNVTAGFFIGDGGLLSNISGTGVYGNSNVAAYLPTYTGNLDNVDVLTANVISSNATIIANSVTLGNSLTPVSVSQWTQQTTASATPIILMTISAADVTHIDFNTVATDTTNSSRQVSKLMAISYNGTVNYNEYGSLLIGSIVGDFTVTTDGTDIFLNVIPSSVNSIDYNVVATVYY